MKQALKWIAGILGTITVLALSYYYFILDWNVRPVCHKQIETVLRIWAGDHGKDASGATNAFPNVNGDSKASLAAIDQELHWGIAWASSWTNRYKYVPGLRETDPGDLILMYMDQPTRWHWHGAPRTRFNEKRWLVVPLDFDFDSRRATEGGECSESLTTDQFKARLEKTLDFVRTNQRPNWQTIAAEHSKFLSSIGSSEH